jgi:hypothetical protein
VGKSEKQFTLTLKVDSIPSRLEASPASIEFGEIPVMTPTIKPVEIINRSPLTAHYVAVLVDLPL